MATAKELQIKRDEKVEVLLKKVDLLLEKIEEVIKNTEKKGKK
jgi:hypothetical protein